MAVVEETVALGMVAMDVLMWMVEVTVMEEMGMEAWWQGAESSELPAQGS